jgi:ssRNA-specific RNase YbeY (16S rRNA maturation enzyme)
MFQITNLTKRKVPKIFWRKIAEKVLGKKYDLSLVFAADTLMKKLNSQYRRKNQPASVLSFPLSKNEGEIFINLNQKKYPPIYLFIHALLHLKGLKHGAKMKERENKLMKEYGARHSYRA